MRIYSFLLLIGFILTGTGAAFSNNPADAFSLYAVKLADDMVIDSIAIHKQEREMLVFSDNQLVKVYRIRLGINPEGRKEISGDYKTPEGLYRTTYLNAASQFHKSFGISYPNAADVTNAKKLGKSAGGDIMVHGLPNRDAHVGMDRYQNDWTWGCIALRNEEIDELFTRVNPGTPILITP